MTNPETFASPDDFNSLVSSVSIEDPMTQFAVHVQRQLAANKATAVDWDNIGVQREMFLKQFIIDNPTFDHDRYLTSDLEGHQGAIRFFDDVIEKAIAAKQLLDNWRQYDADNLTLQLHEFSNKMVITSFLTTVFDYEHSLWPRRMIDTLLPQGSLVSEMDESNFELYTITETGRTPLETYTFYVAEKIVQNQGSEHIKDEVHDLVPHINNQIELVQNVLSRGFELAVDEWDITHATYYTSQANGFRRFTHDTKEEANIKQLFSLAYGADIEYEALLKPLIPTISRIKNACFRGLQVKLNPELTKTESEFDAEAEILLRDFPD